MRTALALVLLVTLGSAAAEEPKTVHLRFGIQTPNQEATSAFALPLGSQ